MALGLYVLSIMLGKRSKISGYKGMVSGVKLGLDGPIWYGQAEP
jgi:hypothetical protein